MSTGLGAIKMLGQTNNLGTVAFINAELMQENVA